MEKDGGRKQGEKGDVLVLLFPQLITRSSCLL